MLKQNLKFILIILIITGVLTTLFLAPHFYSAGVILKSKAETDYNYLKIYNSQNFNLEKQIPLFKDSIFPWGVSPLGSISTIDLGGDGQDEILISAGKGSLPWVKILTNDGWIINEFLAYNKSFKGGVLIAGCDLDGDGRGEIVTGAQSDGGAHVRVFDSYGQIKINHGFFADDVVKNGVQIGCVDINGDNKDEIITITGEDYDKKDLKIFNAQGILIRQTKLNLTGRNIEISAIDLGGDGVEEILVSAGFLDKPLVQIYRNDLSLVNEFLAYNENFKGGVNIVGVDIDNDNKGDIVTMAGITGGPHLRMFDGYGNEKITQDTFIFSREFQGGLSLAIGDTDGDGQKEILVAPQNLPIGNTDLYKYIDIDVSDQKFRYYQNGFLIGDFITSTGKPSTPTRLGEFDTLSKHDMAYGGADGMRWSMPYFIGFYNSGSLQNGIHELPFLNGYREGTNSLGHAVSHGCVRLQIGPAKEVYDWTEVGVTKIFVHK